jgi:hypothetical protein
MILTFVDYNLYNVAAMMLSSIESFPEKLIRINKIISSRNGISLFNKYSLRICDYNYNFNKF